MGQEILFAAPEDQAAGAATLGLDWQTTWPNAHVKGFGLVGLPLVHCLIDGRDPNEIIDPPEWNENPFTKEKMPVTTLDRYMTALELLAEGDARGGTSHSRLLRRGDHGARHTFGTGSLCTMEPSRIGRPFWRRATRDAAKRRERVEMLGARLVGC